MNISEKNKWRTIESINLLQFYEIGVDWFEDAAANLSKLFANRPKDFFTLKSCKNEFNRILSEPHPEHFMRSKGEKYSQKDLVNAWVTFLQKQDKKEAQREYDISEITIRDLVGQFNRLFSGQMSNEEIELHLENLRRKEKDDPSYSAEELESVKNALKNKLKLHEENPDVHPLPNIVIPSKVSAKDIEDPSDDSFEVDQALVSTSQQINESSMVLPVSSLKNLRSPSSPKKARVISESRKNISERSELSSEYGSIEKEKSVTTQRSEEKEADGLTEESKIGLDKTTPDRSKNTDDLALAKRVTPPPKVTAKRITRGSSNVKKKSSLVPDREIIDDIRPTSTRDDKSLEEDHSEKKEKTVEFVVESPSTSSPTVGRKRRIKDSIENDELKKSTTGSRTVKRRNVKRVVEVVPSVSGVVSKVEMQSSPELEMNEDERVIEPKRKRIDRSHSLRSPSKQNDSNASDLNVTSDSRKRSSSSSNRKVKPVEKARNSQHPSETESPLRHPIARRRPKKSDLTESALEQKTLIISAWRTISGHRHAGIFNHPVSHRDARDYSKVVKRPMDLATLKKQIDSGKVQDMLEFKHRLLLMFANAVMFNSTGHDVNNYAKEMAYDALGSLKNMAKDILYMRGGAHITRRSAAFASAETQAEGRKGISYSTISTPSLEKKKY